MNRRDLFDPHLHGNQSNDASHGSHWNLMHPLHPVRPVRCVRFGNAIGGHTDHQDIGGHADHQDLIDRTGAKAREDGPGVSAWLHRRQSRGLRWVGRRMTLAVMVAVISLLPSVVMAQASGNDGKGADRGGEANQDSAEAGKSDAGSASQDQGPPPALVRVGKVLRQELQQRWSAVGRMREVKRSLVAAEQSGRVLSVGVEEGRPVKQGETELVRIDDVLAKIAVEEANARLKQAIASVAQAQAELDQAKRDLAQLEELQERGSARPKEVQDAQTLVASKIASLEGAKARVQTHDAELARAKEELAKHVAYAPFDGVVVTKHIEEGMWVSPGTPVVELVSHGMIDAYIDVPERLINNIAQGDKVELFIDAMNLSLHGDVYAIIPSGTNAARTFPVKVRVDDRDGALKSGMSVTARIPMNQKRPVLTVPRDAISRTSSGKVVWIPQQGRGPMPMAMPVPVRIMFAHEDRFVVESLNPAGPPLQPGMDVVIEGGEALFPMRPLMIANADEQAPPAGARPSESASGESQ